MTSWELTRHAGEVGMAQLPAHASVPAHALADAGISILSQSTFDTDWILVPAPRADACMHVWSAAGHTIDVEQEEE